MNHITQAHLIEATKKARELTFQISDQLLKARDAHVRRRPQDTPPIETIRDLSKQLEEITLDIASQLSVETTLEIR